VLHLMQATSVSSSASMSAAITDRWNPAAAQLTPAVHPFRLHLEDLRIGDTLHTAARTITLADIEHFAEFTGDTFYAHMDEEAAAASPIFNGRVAHGYLVLAFAAGLFVDPAPGPVLANVGLRNLRFLTPVYPGDEIKLRLTAKAKVPRPDTGWGEVTWNVEVTNQEDVVCAIYDLLTMVASRDAALTPPESAADGAPGMP
jgi:oxepin-CoA hydrolase/3-oxo-5,6-dehydrosuberyl-CoA semialdehyde dehydrogenase